MECSGPSTKWSTKDEQRGWRLAQSVQPAVAVDHPSVYHLLDILRTEQNHTEILLAQINSGRSVTETGKTKYVQLARRVNTLIRRNDSSDKLTFLRGIAHNIDF